MHKLWCLVVEHDMTPLGNLFEVEYDDNDSVATLKKKVKEEEKPNDCKNVDADCLIVWQCKEPKLVADVDTDELEDTLKKVNLSDRGKVVELAEATTVISLELCKYEILLVQLPGKHPHSSYNFIILTYQWTVAPFSEDGKAAAALQQYDPYEGLEDSIIKMNVDNFERQVLLDNNIHIIQKVRGCSKCQSLGPFLGKPAEETTSTSWRGCQFEFPSLTGY